MNTGLFRMRLSFLISLWGLSFFSWPILVSAEPVLLPLGADIQSIIEKQEKGTVYRLKSGVHRGHEIILKEGDSLIGEDGAILSGAELLEGWRYEAPYWVHDGPHSKIIPYLDDESRVWEQRANYPHDLFCNDVPLIQRIALTEFLLEGKYWFYDYDNDKVYIGFNPTGFEMELSGLSNYGLSALEKDVTIKNIRFENYATYNLKPAVELGPNATFENSSVSGSHCIGIKISNSSIIRNSSFNYNGLAGLHNGGDGTLIEYCEFGYNGWAGFSGDWARAGCKVPGVTNTVLRRNYAHHNTGPGFWFDINANKNLFEENLSEFNSWEGLIYELSCGCEIRNNILRWNGLDPRGGLLWGVPFVIQNAENANIHNNYFESSPNLDARGGGVSIINQFRPQYTDGVCGEHTAEGNEIYDNVMVMPLGGYNGLQYGRFGWETYSDFLSKPNRWHNNTYYSGKPNRGNFHWYSSGESPMDFVTQFYSWNEWQSVGQDKGSQFIGKHSSFFNPKGEEIQKLILETTGVTYDELKKPFVDTGENDLSDLDEDGLPDYWEKLFKLDLNQNNSDKDLDNDGLSNIVEFQNSTDPTKQDTDSDGVFDGWEIKYGLDPLVADGYNDNDNDSLTNIEEFEIGSDPTKDDLELFNIPLEQLSMWLKSSSIDSNTIGSVPEWTDFRGLGKGMKKPFNHFPPNYFQIEESLYPVVDFGNGSLKSVESNLISDDNGGWTITSVFRIPDFKNDDIQYALMSNDVWRKSGFRLTLQNGYLRFYSTQSEKPISIEAFRKVVTGENLVVTLQYDSINGTGKLYINGNEQGRDDGRIVPSNQALWIGHIGGMEPQKAHYFEVMTFNSHLTHRERRIVESMLMGKHLKQGRGIKDSDRDGMADWFELEFGLSLEPDADDDLDGLNNLQEFLNHTNPLNHDSDNDGLKDNWEIDNGWNPLLNDLLIDADKDGLNSVYELEVGANPNEKDTDQDQMLDGWEYNNGLNPIVKDDNDDPDRDGLTNLLEFVFSTDPLNPDTDNDTLTDSQEILNGWNPLQNAIITDSDEDGLSDFKEFRLGTNIKSPDSDNDLISDSDEVAYGLDPLTNDANDDSDNDGLINIKEVNYKTNPFDNDTDKDEILDGWEIENFLNPLLDDSKEDFDFDGILNLIEFRNKTNPIEWIDSDRDGMHDLWEKTFGFDDKKNESQNDDDGDNVSNLVEFILGGDPIDEDSVPDLKVEYLNDDLISLSHNFSNYRYYFYEIVLQKMGVENQWEDLLKFNYQIRKSNLSEKTEDNRAIRAIYRMVMKRLP